MINKRLLGARIIVSIAAAMLISSASRAALAANDSLSGAIFTTTADGTIVNANTQYESKCAVYLDGGPGSNAPSRAAGLPAGEYYFQVTDPSGKILLSTDKVSNRRFRVSPDGVIVAYTGVGGDAHPIGADKDHASKGAITIRLANLTCPTDFATTPNDGGVYKVWVTPVGDGTPTGGGFVGNSDLVDNGYSAGYYHGFLPARSKTDTFKVRAVAVTFCLTVQKQVVKRREDLTVIGPGAGWPMTLEYPEGATKLGHTALPVSGDGTYSEVEFCSLVPGEYTVREALQFNADDDSAIEGFFVAGLMVNGVFVSPCEPTDEPCGWEEPTYTFVWQVGDPKPVIRFLNVQGEDVLQ
jgi:hypothetical protein